MSATAMTHRKRVLAALRHEQPDRVPRDLGSTRNSTATQGFYQRLKAHFGLPGGPEADVISGKMMQTVQIDERILRALDVDVRGVHPGAPDRNTEEEYPDGSYKDEWGVLRAKPPSSYYYDQINYPLIGPISKQDILSYPFPDPDDPGRYRGLKEQLRQVKALGDYAVILNITLGVIHTSQYLRGYEDWFCDVAADPDLLGLLMDRLAEFCIAATGHLLDEVGQEVDMVYCGDDMGTQNGTIISPDSYRRLIKPRQKLMFGFVHDRTPAKIVYHTCGSVYDILPDLVEVGVDVLQPLQLSAAKMDPVKIKAEFGSKLAFWGGMDIQHVLPHGTVDEVTAEVRLRSGQLGAGGGFILAPGHNVQPDVPVENLAAMYAAAGGA